VKTPLHFLIAIVLMGALVSCERAPANSIDSAELTERISNNTAPFILDVRTESEFVVSHIPGAVNVPHTEVSKRVAELPIDKATEIVIYCTKGVRAASAEETLIVAGYQNIRTLNGNFAEWSKLELPLAHGITR